MKKPFCKIPLVTCFLTCLLLDGSAVCAEKATIQASFNCDNARTKIEQFICKNKSVGSLDVILSDVYKGQLKVATKEKKEQLKQSQRSWLRKRTDCIGMLPSEEYFCVLASYHERIKELGGIQQLVSHYKQSCAKEDWDCKMVGDLELSIGNLPEAVKYYSILCEADHDGDNGDSCYKKASVLEKMGKVSDSKTLYNTTCQNRHNNDACGAALRLGPKLSPSDHWSGLYRNERGSLFVGMKNDGNFTISMETQWANGHQCSFLGSGFIKNDIATITPDQEDECIPEIVKTDKIISLKDPTGKCQSHWCGMRGNFEGDFMKEVNSKGQP